MGLLHRLKNRISSDFHRDAGFVGNQLQGARQGLSKDWARDYAPLHGLLSNFGHDISQEWKGEGGFGGRVKGLGLGSYKGRRNAAIIAALTAGGIAAAGAGAGAGGAGAAESAGAAGIPTGWAGSTGATLGGGLGAGIGGGTLAAAAPAAAGAGGGFWGGFGGQALLSTGGNLLSGYLGNRAQAKSDKANQKAIEARIRQALAALSPEHIMALAQQFLPQMAANMSTAGQTAIQGVREQAARTGQLETPRALNFEAGLRAKLAQDTQAAAFERAFGLAGNQASAISGAPYFPQQPRTGVADAFTNSINQAFLARALSQRQPQQQTPYRYPYTPGIPFGYGGQY